MFLSFSLAACSGQQSKDPSDKVLGTEDTTDDSNVSDDQEPNNQGEENGSKEEEDDKPEPILDADATDEELLEVLRDEIHVVTDDNYIEMLTKFREDTNEYAGQIYQIEGNYTMEGETPYISRILVDGEEKSVSGLPLKYLEEEPAEGDWIRVTGIINADEVDGKQGVVLEAIVVEILEEQGQAELPVH